MRRLPPEFEDLLTPRGRRVLAGPVPGITGALADPRRRFLALSGLIDRRRAEGVRALLEARLLAHLQPLAAPIPPETIWEMRRNYEEWLPKAMRLKTAYLERRQGRAYEAAAEIGLVRLMQSPSLHAFASALAGRPLAPRRGMQVLCYGAGDYVGPHNDHHPEDAAAAGGYFDLHVNLAGPDVAQQWLVYARGGHFTEIVNVASLGTINAYRLPFWHYTTPLVAKRGREGSARRWLLLATFLFAPEKKKPKPQPEKNQARGRRKAP